MPIPESLAGWIQEFVDLHYIEEPFVKRKRNKHRVDLIEEGKGDVRISQESDVYRAPSAIKKRRTH